MYAFQLRAPREAGARVSHPGSGPLPAGHWRLHVVKRFTGAACPAATSRRHAATCVWTNARAPLTGGVPLTETGCPPPTGTSSTTRGSSGRGAGAGGPRRQPRRRARKRRAWWGAPAPGPRVPAAQRRPWVPSQGAGSGGRPPRPLPPPGGSHSLWPRRDRGASPHCRHCRRRDSCSVFDDDNLDKRGRTASGCEPANRAAVAWPCPSASGHAAPERLPRPQHCRGGPDTNRARSLSLKKCFGGHFSPQG